MCKFARGCRADGTDVGDSAQGSACLISNRSVQLRFPKDSYVYHQGDRALGLYCLLSGLVSLQRADDQGNTVMLRLLRPGRFFSAPDLIADGMHRASARALTEAQVCHVSRSALATAAEKDPGVARLLLRSALEELRAYEDAVFHVGTNKLAQRLHALLCEFAEAAKPGHGETVTFTLPILRKELAEMLGTSASVLSRTIARLESTEQVVFRGQQVTLHRPATAETEVDAPL